MKKKIIIISVIILFVVLLPFTVLAAKNMISYTKSGKPIVSTCEAVPDEIKGQEFALAVPVNESETRDDILQKEKNDALNKITSEKITTFSTTEKNKIKEEIDISANKKETLDSESEFVVVFKKYFGNKETEALFTSIKNETEANAKNNTKYTFPENGKKLLNAVLDIIDNSNPTKEEINILKKVVQSMDLTTLDDKELVKRINNL